MKTCPICGLIASYDPDGYYCFDCGWEELPFDDDDYDCAEDWGDE
jgi:hypothetical protein